MVKASSAAANQLVARPSMTIENSARTSPNPNAAPLVTRPAGNGAVFGPAHQRIYISVIPHVKSTRGTAANGNANNSD